MAASLLLFFTLSGAGFDQNLRVRISGWYWLNSAPKVDWEGDFVTMRNLGFTDVVLCWGIDTAAFVTRMEDSRYAMQMAHRAGIGAYVLLWHPYANALERDPKFLQVDSSGKVLRTFDTFNPECRNTQWKQYLQTVAKAYGYEPAMSGYVFDDSFEVGGTGTVSYGEYERQKFGHALSRKPTDPYWKEWYEIRAQWWEDWAEDTTKFIREVDPNHEHLNYLEDTAGQVLNPKLPDMAGADFVRVSRHFDAVGGYTLNPWDLSPDSGVKVAQRSKEVLAELRKALGPKQKIVYTFWVANEADGNHPGPAKSPSVGQILLLCKAALKSGIHYIDRYGFRIGESGVPDNEIDRVTPGTAPTLPLTGQIPQRFLWDRPEILDELGRYLRGLNGK